METNQIMQLAYLSLLAAAIGGSYIVANRGQMGKMAQQAAIWALIFVGVVGAVGLWNDVSQTVSPRQSVLSANEIVVPRGFDGHYYLTLDVNDVPVDFVIDTGASQIVLSREDARAVGINPDTLRYSGRANTANGVVQTAPTRLASVTLGEIQDFGVPAVVNGGEMDGSLLGMTYLGAFSSIEIRGNEMVLTR